MIWSLAREQVRSQKRYTVATAALIAVTVALAAYGAFMALTVAHSSAVVDHLLGTDRDSSASASTAEGYDLADLTTHVDAANAEGHEVVASAHVAPTLTITADDSGMPLAALYGDVDWNPVLVAGAAPRPGEIAVNAEWAEAHGAQIGDSLRLVWNSWDGSGTPVPLGRSLVVSGLTRSPFAEAGIEIQIPSGFVEWSDVPGLNEAWADAENTNAPDNAGAVTGDTAVTISGNGAWQWNEALRSMSYDQNEYVSPPASALTIGILASIGVAALLAGITAAAFALGRTQGQARSAWVGTARALGATRRHIVAATLLECAVVGVGAGIAGVVLGALVSAAHLLLVVSRIASPMLVAAPAGYAAIATLGLVFALALALIMGVVPAYWAARVAPSAALKPTRELGQIAVASRSRVLAVAGAWALSCCFTVFATITRPDGPVRLVLVLAFASLAVTSVMLAHEVLRRSLPWHARRLARSPRRAVLVAGDAILARPRQVTVPAFITALATTIVVALFEQLVASWAVSNAEADADTTGFVPHPNPYISPLIFLGVSVVVTVLCVAVAVATAAVTAREAATRQALGLTAAEGRVAAGIQYLVAHIHGLALGLIGGGLGAVLALYIGIDDPWLHIGDWAGDVTRMVFVVAGVASACALVGAALVSALAPATAPLATVEARA